MERNCLFFFFHGDASFSSHVAQWFFESAVGSVWIWCCSLYKPRNRIAFWGKMNRSSEQNKAHLRNGPWSTLMYPGSRLLSSSKMESLLELAERRTKTPENVLMSVVPAFEGQMVILFMKKLWEILKLWLDFYVNIHWLLCKLKANSV